MNLIYLEHTHTLCSICLQAIPGKIIQEGEQIRIHKRCPEHGLQNELLEEHAPFYLSRNTFLKAGTASKLQTQVEKGCPYDCGICPEHHQHTCIGLIEVTQDCDLACPICYADSCEHGAQHLPMDKIESMMDFYQEAEGGQAEILQISGGEPTTHPQILDILKLAKQKKFKYVMLNTNGKRIAQDQAFSKALGSLRGDFELYLQFDGVEKSTHNALRGVDLRAMKKEALKRIVEHKIPTTLVATVHHGVNDHELADIIDTALHTPMIRGINFQPIAYYGRYEQAKSQQDRVTLTGILDRIGRQTAGMITKEDFIPLPCNVDRIAVSYFYRSKKGLISLTKNAGIRSYLPLLNNTLDYRVEDFLDENGKVPKQLLKGCDCVKELTAAVPKNFLLKPKSEKVAFVDENTFRITVSSFIDRYNFDMKSQQRECVHMITEDLKRIPFSTYNMIHRKERS